LRALGSLALPLLLCRRGAGGRYGVENLGLLLLLLLGGEGGGVLAFFGEATVADRSRGNVVFGGGEVGALDG